MPKRFSRIVSSILGLSLILTLLAACGAGTGTGDTGNQETITIKIGSNFPTTANDASSGKPAENGVALAVKEANDTQLVKGVKFVHVAKDDVGAGGVHDQTVAKRNIDELLGDSQVAAVVGPLNSSIAQAIMPSANNGPIALISPSNTNDCLTQDTPDYACGGDKSKVKTLRPTGKVTYFRTATLDQYQGAALAAYAFKTKGYKTAYVIDDTEAYGQGLATTFVYYFKQFGGNVLGQKSIKSTNSYESVLTQIASQKPDVIFFGGNDSTGGITIRQQMARSSGLKDTPFVIGDGSKTGSFTKAIGPTKGGPVFVSVPGVDTSRVPAAKAFTDSYVKAYGQANLGAYSGGAYDDTKIVLKAISNVLSAKTVAAPKSDSDDAGAKAFRQAVIDEIQKVQFEGVTGTHSFDKNGDTTNRAISIYTIADDVTVGDGWKFLEEVDPTKV